METLLENQTFQAGGLFLASAAVALAVAYCLWEMIAIVTAPRIAGGTKSPFEAQRRDVIRLGNPFYRWLEPLVDELTLHLRGRQRRAMDTIAQSLVVSREKLPWTPEEFVVTKWLEAVVIGSTLFTILWLAGWTTLSILLGTAVAVIYGFMAPKSIRDVARRRMARIRVRLPFAVDLIALTMEAGGNFQECLQTAVSEIGKHPLTEELSEVLRQISLGRPRHEALRALQDRLRDDDINELVFAINKGEELGTPLSAILRDQAEQMRLKRSQRGEKAAAEAQVNIVFPGMIVMIACLLVVMAPIVLPAVLALF